MAPSDLPDRIQRAIRDRDVKYREAKLRVVQASQGLVMAFDRAAAEVRRWNIEKKILNDTPAASPDGTPRPLPQVRPVEFESLSLNIEQAAQQLKMAYDNYKSELEHIDYDFFQKFADIYGPGGGQEKLAPPKHSDLDNQIQFASDIYGNRSYVLYAMTGMNPDWRGILRRRLSSGK